MIWSFSYGTMGSYCWIVPCPIQKKVNTWNVSNCFPPISELFSTIAMPSKKVEVIHSCTWRQNPTTCSFVILSIMEKSTDVSAMKPKSRIVTVVVNPFFWFAEFLDLPMHMWTYLTYLKSKVTCSGEWSWTYYTPPSRESNCPTFAKPGKQTYDHPKGLQGTMHINGG